jgi:hypothetical protein
MVFKSEDTLMRLVLRAIGWTFLSIALILLGRDLIHFATEGRFEPMALGFLWHSLHSGSLQLAEAAVSRYVHPVLWHPVIATLLLWPAFAVFGVIGMLMLLLGRRRERAERIFGN